MRLLRQSRSSDSQPRDLVDRPISERGHYGPDTCFDNLILLRAQELWARQLRASGWAGGDKGNVGLVEMEQGRTLRRKNEQERAQET